MATDLGKVGMRARGDWTSSATYEVLDVVSYQNGLYVAKQAVPANTVPTNTTYWQVAINYSTIYTQVPSLITSADWKHSVGFTCLTYGYFVAIMGNKMYICTVYNNGNNTKVVVTSTASVDDIILTTSKVGNRFEVILAFANSSTSNSISILSTMPVDYDSIAWNVV